MSSYEKKVFLRALLQERFRERWRGAYRRVFALWSAAGLPPLEDVSGDQALAIFGYLAAAAERVEEIRAGEIPAEIRGLASRLLAEQAAN